MNVPDGADRSRGGPRASNLEVTVNQELVGWVQVCLSVAASSRAISSPRKKPFKIMHPILPDKHGSLPYKHPFKKSILSLRASVRT